MATLVITLQLYSEEENVGPVACLGPLTANGQVGTGTETYLTQDLGSVEHVICPDAGRKNITQGRAFGEELDETELGQQGSHGPGDALGSGSPRREGIDRLWSLRKTTGAIHKLSAHL